MILPFRELKKLREDNRTIAEENAYDDFLEKVEAVTRAQGEMNEAHKRYIAIKYPRGVPNGR